MQALNLRPMVAVSIGTKISGPHTNFVMCGIFLGFAIISQDILRQNR